MSNENEWSPTTDEVRAASSRYLGAVEFDRWLVAHDAEVAAKALEDAAADWFAHDTHGVARFTEEVQAELRKRAAALRASTGGESE